MDRLLSMEAFIRVAESGSFIEAARQLGVTRSVVTNRVRQLEQFIQAPLFHRSTRHVRLSEVGQAYFHECADMVDKLHSLIDRMREMRSQPRGTIRIQVAPGFAIDHFGFLLAEFTQRYPEIDLDIVVDDRIVDPIVEGFDVSFQLFPPQAETLVERRLFPVHRIFCASPRYLTKRSKPTRPTDLLEHDVALYAGYPSRLRFSFAIDTETLELAIPAKVRSTSVHLLRDFALSGAGIVCLPTMVASKALLTGKLVPILTDYTMSALGFRAVFAATQRHTVKVRTFIDFLAERIGTAPAWDRPLIEKGWLQVSKIVV